MEVSTQNVFREAFGAILPLGDHFLDLTQFLDMCRKTGICDNEEIARTIFNHIDRDKNGTIDMDEFMAFMEEASKLVGSTEMLDSIFEMLDVNGDGKVPTDHLRDIVVNKAYALTEEEYNILFEDLDTNGDGTMSLEKFKEVMKGGMLY